MPVAALLLALGRGNVFTQIAVFFSEMAVVTFGGAYAVLAYVAQQAVEHYQLAAARRDARRPRHGGDDARAADHGAAVRRLHGRVPRPGRLAAAAGRHARRPAGDLGHVHAVLPVDLPRRALHRALRGNKALAGALSAITAAVVGVILNLAIWFAIHTLFREVRRCAARLRFDAPVLTQTCGHSFCPLRRCWRFSVSRRA